jgi:AcrR family transcriptional regulator
VTAGRLDTRIRREQIAQAALALIAAKGMRGLSLAAVAKQVGLVPSAIYRHFESKDRLVDVAMEHLGERLLSNVHVVEEETRDPIERLHRLLARHMRLIGENQAVPRIIFTEGVYGGRTERKERVHTVITRYIEHIAQFVLDGQRSGRIRSDLDPRAAAVTFLGLILPPAVLWHLSDGGFDPVRQSERGWSIFRAGIEAPRKASTRTAKARRSRTKRGGGP